jgi:hypothetical protein
MPSLLLISVRTLHQPYFFQVQVTLDAAEDWIADLVAIAHADDRAALHVDELALQGVVAVPRRDTRFIGNAVGSRLQVLHTRGEVPAQILDLLRQQALVGCQSIKPIQCGSRGSEPRLHFFLCSAAVIRYAKQAYDAG